MRVHIYSPNRIEPWTWRNVTEIGIGGSETSHVEMAIRLAARGHDVVSYTDLPASKIREQHAGVAWADLEDAGDLSASGLWIVYRKPSVGATITPVPDRRYWLVCQDVFYPDWKKEDVAKFDRVIGLCPRHLDHLAELDPENRARLCLSSNGVNVERVSRLEASGPAPRVPHRLIWTSSPDRGLKELLDIVERAREYVPELELQCYYGMDNIDKICGGDRAKKPWATSWAVYDRALAMPGVTWFGRVGQDALAQAFRGAGLWCYPTWFSETSCISCMEAQALGAIPITNPIWATAHNVEWGTFVEGDPSDPLTRARYVAEVVRLASDPALQEAVRSSMMSAARARFDWERVVDQWNDWALAPARAEAAA